MQVNELTRHVCIFIHVDDLNKLIKCIVKTFKNLAITLRRSKIIDNLYIVRIVSDHCGTHGLPRFLKELTIYFTTCNNGVNLVLTIPIVSGLEDRKILIDYVKELKNCCNGVTLGSSIWIEQCTTSS